MFFFNSEFSLILRRRYFFLDNSVTTMRNDLLILLYTIIFFVSVLSMSKIDARGYLQDTLTHTKQNKPKTNQTKPKQLVLGVEGRSFYCLNLVYGRSKGARNRKTYDTNFDVSGIFVYLIEKL